MSEGPTRDAGKVASRGESRPASRGADRRVRHRTAPLGTGGALLAAMLLALLPLGGGCGDDGDPTAPDTVAVRPGEPLLDVSATLLRFSLAQSRATFLVVNRGGGLLHWTVAANADWLTMIPAAGTAAVDTDTVVVTLDRAWLTPGDHAAALTVQGGERTLRVDVVASAAAEPVWTYSVLASYPHDPQAFTQGLTVADGSLYEGTGLYGQSSLRRVALETGVVLQQHRLASTYFGEGIAVVGDRIVQLTWLSGTGFVYDRGTFAPLETFAYAGQGWGLAYDGTRLIMSDGTSRLRFLDPVTFAETGHVAVTAADGRAVDQLNELEFVDGEVWANVWQRDHVVRIDPADGRVAGWIDFTGLRAELEEPGDAEVLNGIARDAAGRILVTGKLWPRLFAVELIPTTGVP